MIKYREILRLYALGFSQQNIAYSCGASKKTVNRVIHAAEKMNLSWPLEDTQTDDVLAKLLSPSSVKKVNIKHQPDLSSIHKELMKNGVSKKLLWTE